MTLFEAMRKLLLAGFGAQEKLMELVDELIEKGELNESQGAKLIKEWSEKAEKGTEDLNKNLSDLLSKSLERMNIPGRAELTDIDNRLKALEARVSKIEESSGKGS